MSRPGRRHALPIVVTHWVNAGAFAVMVWSGLMIASASPYRANLGPLGVVEIFPERFYEALGVDGRLPDGMAWHFAGAWIFVLNGLAYVGFLAGSGAWRRLAPDGATPADLRDEIRRNLRLAAPPRSDRLYPGAQRLAYSAAIAIGLVLVLSGLAIYKPVQLAWLAALFGGYQGARLAHFVATGALIGFVVVHVIEVARAGWACLRGMIGGREPAPIAEASPRVEHAEAEC